MIALTRRELNVLENVVGAHHPTAAIRAIGYDDELRTLAARELIVSDVYTVATHKGIAAFVGSDPDLFAVAQAYAEAVSP